MRPPPCFVVPLDQVDFLSGGGLPCRFSNCQSSKLVTFRRQTGLGVIRVDFSDGDIDVPGDPLRHVVPRYHRSTTAQSTGERSWSRRGQCNWAVLRFRNSGDEPVPGRAHLLAIWMRSRDSRDIGASNRSKKGSHISGRKLPDRHFSMSHSFPRLAVTCSVLIPSQCIRPR